MRGYEVAQIVISKGFRNRKEPLAFANMQGEGKIDPAEHVVNFGAKFVNEVFETAWKMETAKARQECKLKSSIQPLREALQGECTREVKSECYACASHLFTNNSV